MSSHEGGAAALFEVRYSIPGHAALLALLLVPLVPATWILAAGLQDGGRLAVLVGGLGTACFGSGALAVLVRIFDRRVRLCITGETLWLPDHSQTPIPLRSIKKVRYQDNWIALFLYKPERFPPTNRYRRFVRFIFSGASGREQYGDAWIYPVLFECSSDELLRRI